jgi:hypothetical protein
VDLPPSQSRAPESHWGTPLTIAVALGLLALAVALGLQDIRSFDYWWQLRTGELIAATGAVPKTDVYTYTVPGSRYIDIHWLHQLGLHGLHSLGGHAAVVVGKAVLISLLVAILGTIGWRRERAAVTGLGLGLALLVAADRLMPRPELPTFVCLAALLALCHRFERRGDAWIYAVIPVQIVWVNVHGLFAVGLAVLAIYLAGELLRPLVQPGAALRKERIRRLLAVTALATLASLLNPNFVDGALYPIQQLGMIGPAEERGIFGSVIAELLPPLGAEEQRRGIAIPLFAALAGLSLAAIALNWRRTRGADPLLWVAFLYLALSAHRNMALFALVAGPLIVVNLNEFLDSRPPHAARSRVAAVLVTGLLAFASFDVASGGFYRRIGSVREAGLGVVDFYYPIGAGEWIARERPPGPICHHMADGGYLIWRLWPDYSVMVDGRLEVFGAERFIELQVTSPERFRALDAEYGFGTVLVHYSLVQSGRLLRWLHLNSNWRLTFLDDVAAVFVRVGAEPPPWPAVDLDAKPLFAPLPDERGVRDVARRQARTNFYIALRRYDEALELWEESRKRHPDLPNGAIVHATLLHRAGFPAAAEAILRSLVEEHPGDPVLLAQVGDLRLEAGDRTAAKAFYARSREIDPDRDYTLLRTGMIAESEGDLEQAAMLYARVDAVNPPTSPIAQYARARLAALAGR